MRAFILVCLLVFQPVGVFAADPKPSEILKDVENNAEDIFRQATNLYEEKKYSEALQLYRKAAEIGLASAQYNLGLLYKEGLGTEKDLKEAFKWYSKAAEKRHKDAYHNLGVLYETGEGVEKNVEKAGEMYGMASRAGLKTSNDYLRNHFYYCVANFKKAPKGANGAGHKEAAESCLLSAASGNSEAQFILGVSYLFGTIVEKDSEKSRHWFYEAARQGHVMAQYHMVLAYVNGVNDDGAADMAVANGWLCVLEKQVKAQGSPGLEMWRGSGHEDKLRQLQSHLGDVVPKNAITGALLKEICEGYIKNYYKDPAKQEKVK